MLYTVKCNDSLSSIAEAHGLSPASLSTLNQLDPHTRPVAGQSLLLPDVSDAPRRNIIVHGCAVPGAGDSALTCTAPYLTCLSVVGCCMQSDGTLTTLNDQTALRRIANGSSAPLLSIKPYPAYAGTGNTVHHFLKDVHAREEFEAQLLRRISDRGYSGTDICFGNILPEDIDSFSGLIKKLSTTLHERGLRLQVTISEISECLSAIHSSVDSIILSLYETEPVHTAPAPICPMTDMSEALSQATAIIPAEKLLLSIPTHGYNWALPHFRCTARIVYPSEAPNLAYSHFADIRYDHTAQAPNFSYYDSSGTERMVWFNDMRSIAARLELVDSFRLGGVSLGSIAPLYRPCWTLLMDMYCPVKLHRP